MNLKIKTGLLFIALTLALSVFVMGAQVTKVGDVNLNTYYAQLLTAQQVYSADASLYATTGQAYCVVPRYMNAWYIYSVDVYVLDASSSGTPTFQLTNMSQSFYYLDTLLTIDATEHDSSLATVASALYANYRKIYANDTLRLDCSVLGTGTNRLQMRIVVQPNI